MKSARIALAEAYHLYLTSPSLEIYESKTGYVPLKKVFDRIKRDKKGNITHIPCSQSLNAKQTTVRKTSTTSLIAMALEAGSIIAAAEGRHQPETYSNWLRLCYDPGLDLYRDKERELFAESLRAMWGAWCFSEKSRKPDIANLNKYKSLCQIVLRDTIHRFRCRNKLYTTEQKARFLQYQDAKSANWSRSWGLHEMDMYEILDKMDREALRPVVMYLVEREDEAEKHLAEG